MWLMYFKDKLQQGKTKLMYSELKMHQQIYW